VGALRVAEVARTVRVRTVVLSIWIFDRIISRKTPDSQ